MPAVGPLFRREVPAVGANEPICVLSVVVRSCRLSVCSPKKNSLSLWVVPRLSPLSLGPGFLLSFLFLPLSPAPWALSVGAVNFFQKLFYMGIIVFSEIPIAIQSFTSAVHVGWHPFQ